MSGTTLDLSGRFDQLLSRFDKFEKMLEELTRSRKDSENPNPNQVLSPPVQTPMAAPNFPYNSPAPVNNSQFTDYMIDLKLLKQDSSVQEYNSQFQKLSKKVQGIPETCLVSHYIGGLKEEIRFELQLSNPKSLLTAMQLSKLHEAKFMAIRRNYKGNSDLSKNGHATDYIPNNSHSSFSTEQGKKSTDYTRPRSDSTDHVFSNQGNPEQIHTIKSHEERILEAIVPSGGVRLQPTRDVNQVFLAEALKLDVLAMSHALDMKLQSQVWQGMTTRCDLESNWRKEDKEQFSVKTIEGCSSVEVVPIRRYKFPTLKTQNAYRIWDPGEMLNMEIDLPNLGTINTMSATLFNKLGVPIKMTISATDLEDPKAITLSIEEYGELRCKTQEDDEISRMKMEAALAEVEEASLVKQDLLNFTSPCWNSSLGNKQSLSMTAAGVCRDGAMLLTGGHGESKGFCWRITCVKCLGSNGDVRLINTVPLVKNHIAGRMSKNDQSDLPNGQTRYVLLLCSFKEQLQKHVRVHAMETVMACWELELSLQSLTCVFHGEGTCANMSDDDSNQVDFHLILMVDAAIAFGVNILRLHGAWMMSFAYCAIEQRWCEFVGPVDGESTQFLQNFARKYSKVWDPGPSSVQVIDFHVGVAKELKDSFLEEGAIFHVLVWDPGIYSACSRVPCISKLQLKSVAHLVSTLTLGQGQFEGVGIDTYLAE